MSRPAGPPRPRIIGPREWGARPPAHRHQLHGPPVRALLHGTAGHHRELERPGDESLEELCRYARDVQAFHMAPPPHGRGWSDTGQSFLIGRNGIILAGRWYTLAAAKVGLIVEQAHCPGQNDQFGIELEHAGDEVATGRQLRAWVELVAWLFSRAGCRPHEQHPHGLYFPTSCPTRHLEERLPWMRSHVAVRLNDYGRRPATYSERARFRARYAAGLI